MATFSNGITTDKKLSTKRDVKNYQKPIILTPDKYYTFGDGDEECEYNIKIDNIRSTHWGQLKLFVSELQVLTYYGDPSICNTIIYVGAAPGEHLFLLARMFSEYNFHLYDLKQFDKRLEELDNVTLYNKYFTQEDVDKWKKKDIKIFLISDIRSLNYTKLQRVNSQKAEDEVWENMNMQKDWYIQMECYMGLFKFKLPYVVGYNLKKGKTREYLDGIVFRQVYQKNNSSETRLLTRGIGYRDWDIVRYEKKNAYHNQVSREKTFFKNPIDFTDDPIYPEQGFLNDYDSVVFATILKDFLIKINQEVDLNKIRNLIDLVISEVTITGKNKLISKGVENDDEEDE